MAVPCLFRPLPIAIALGLLFQCVAFAEPVDIELPGPRLLTYHYQLTGESREELFREATVRAVSSAAGRVYFSNYSLRGRELLAPYIGQYWERFRAGQRVLADEVRGGRRYLDIEITVDQQQLIRDLAEKRFLYRPAFRPVFYLFLTETAPGGKPAETARKRLLETIDERQYRYLWEGDRMEDPKIPLSKKKERVLTEPSPYKDVAGTAESLLAACREAQRNEIEVVLTGTVETTLKNEKTIYFDKYAFVETKGTLKLVRSDTGEVLASAEMVRSAAHQDAGKATEAATLAVVNEIAPKVFDEFDRVWAKTVLRKADLRLMITGAADDETLRVVRQVLTGARPNAEIYERGRFGEVAVLTMTWGDDVDRLVGELNATAHPDFRLIRTEADSMIMEIVH